MKHPFLSLPTTGCGLQLAATNMDDRAVRALVIDRMVEHFALLLRMQPSDGLLWDGTLTDLMETTHIVWATGRILDARGLPMTFSAMVRRVCAVLHRRVPSNPSALASRGAARKNVRARSVLCHYTELIVKARLVNPFQMEVVEGRS